MYSRVNVDRKKGQLPGWLASRSVAQITRDSESDLLSWFPRLDQLNKLQTRRTPGVRCVSTPIQTCRRVAAQLYGHHGTDAVAYCAARVCCEFCYNTAVSYSLNNPLLTDEKSSGPNLPTV